MGSPAPPRSQDQSHRRTHAVEMAAGKGLKPRRHRTDTFLSDPDEYEGGELVIEDHYGTQAVKLNAGDMVLYPSTSLHEVRPVTRGARVSSFFWLQSMVRSNEQRTMLFDLDQTIQALAERLDATDADVVRLTGIYHNMIRMWSEV